eukprot:gene16272-18570_t
MDQQCYLCERKKFKHEASDAVAQTAHITKRLDELAALRRANDELRSCIGKTIPDESDVLSKQKAKYINLLQKKEQLLHRVHKAKESARYSDEDLAVLSSHLRQLQNSNVARKNTLATMASVTPCLEKELEDRTKLLRIHRMNAAGNVFKLMAIDAQHPERIQHRTDKEQEMSKKAELSISGCSSILSVPLPNSGDYSGTPVDVVSTAVAHIAHLVDALVSAQHDLWARAQIPNFSYSLCPAKQVNNEGFKEFDWTSLDQLPTGRETGRNVEPFGTHPQAPTSSSRSVVVKAIVNGDMREYALNSNFSMALVLLQANVVALCVRAGLSAESLWPAEAMLLNLHLLQQHCAQVVNEEKTTLLSIHEVPIINAISEDEACMQHLQREQTLRSLCDHYGSQAAIDALNSKERFYLLGEGGKSVRADFSPERSGLAREEEWDIIHMS